MIETMEAIDKIITYPLLLTNQGQKVVNIPFNSIESSKER